MAPRTIREFLDKRIPLVFDGAMGTELQKLGLGPGDSEGHPECNEIYNVTRPEAVTALHRRYFEAGAVVVETNTIGGNRVKLAAYGFGGRAYEINLAAARAARAAAGVGESPRFVCGAMGPTGMAPGQGETPGFDDLVAVYAEQARGLLDGGVDMLLLETQQVLLEVRAAIVGARRAMAAAGRQVALAVQATFDEHGRMLLGADVKAFLGAVANLGPDIVGINCGTGPLEMRATAEALLEISPFPVSVQPNAGIPENVDGRAVYRMAPEEFARAMAPLVLEKGVAVAGGCCGTTPDHIRALAERISAARVAARVPRTVFCFAGSGIGGVELESGPAPVIIGERLNAQGSRKTKELLLASNWEELHRIALEQVRQGAVALDLCVAVSELDNEAQAMRTLVAYLAERVEAAFCIDTTEPAVLEQALKVAPGAVLVNSINLEHGGEKARKVLDLARDFGAAVIGLTIDDQGMARTAERKLALAHQLAELACGRYGLPEHRLYVDPLVFTLATGEPESADAAVQSLEALRRIRKHLPGVRTVMGVSNVSFGLQPGARRVLNNLMLRHAVDAGLRAAIYNPGHLDDIATYDSRTRQLAEDLLLNRRPDALAAFVQHFEQQTRPAKERSGSVPGAAVPARSPEQELRNRILSRDRRDLARLVEQALATVPPEKLLNEVLMPAMAEVGELMAAGKMILPFVLQSAEVMKEAVALVEPHLDHTRRVSRGKIVLATVFGDVHDIGKNLVGSILRNQGFEVVDLGRQVPSQTIVEAAVRERPVAVGLSALLVTTSREMATVVAGLAGAGLSMPVLIGGAAVNQAYAERITALPDGKRYAGGVHYCRNAFEAVRVLEGAARGVSAPAAAGAGKALEVAATEAPVGSFEFIEPAEHAEPPFYGTSQVLVWEPGRLVDDIRQERLFKGYWKGGALGPEEYAKAEQEQFRPAWQRVREELVKDGMVEARGLYGFFPVITDGELVIVLNPGDNHTELASFRFPRVARAGNRSIADYFRPEGDIIAVQAVTLGPGVSARVRTLLQEKNEYSLGFYLNGAANLMTEDLAERVTREIRRALSLDRERGRRYSFGYPGLPGVEAQGPLFELIGVEDRLGVTLTPGFLMEPEHSTVGIFVHHPKAEYL